MRSLFFHTIATSLYTCLPAFWKFEISPAVELRSSHPKTLTHCFLNCLRFPIFKMFHPSSNTACTHAHTSISTLKSLVNFYSRDFLFHKEFDDSTLAKRHIVVGHFVRSHTSHVMQAIDVTRHSRITQQLVPSTTALSFVCCSQFSCKKKVAHDFRYDPRTYVVVTCISVSYFPCVASFPTLKRCKDSDLSHSEVHVRVASNSSSTRTADTPLGCSTNTRLGIVASDVKRVVLLKA